MGPEAEFLKPFKTRTDYATREEYWNHIMAEVYESAMKNIRFAAPESFEGQMVRKLAYLRSQKGEDLGPERNFLYAEGRMGYGLVLADMNIDQLKQQVSETVHIIHKNKKIDATPDCWSEAEWQFAQEIESGSIVRFSGYNL